MANSKERSLYIIDTVGPVAVAADKTEIVGWNLYASNATWSITLKTTAGLIIYRSGNDSPPDVLCKPMSAAAGIDCTQISNCTMRLYYHSAGK